MTAQAVVQAMDGFDPAIAQFRLTRIQLVNWGPFHGYHVVDVHRDGTLVTGPSGAGKSTLLDAMICVLMDRSVTFNAAAHDEAVGSRERTFYSYVRGKTGSRRDGGRGGSRAIYLRERATWSAVALTWSNLAGRTVTACRAMHMTADATSDPDITHALMLAEQDLDVRDLEPAVEQRLRQDAIRRAVPSVTTFGTEYGRYVARLSALVGIRGQDGDSAKAIRLLHKAQSSKGVHNIDDTFKRFVLDDSKVAARRDAAVEQFVSLRNGYEQMTRARDQIALLTPLPALWETYRAAGGSRDELRALLGGADGPSPVEAYVLGVHKELLAERAEHERAEHVRQGELHAAAAAEHQEAADDVRRLEQQRWAQGGGDLDRVDAELRELAATHERAARRHADLERWCGLVDVPVPGSARGLAALHRRRPAHDGDDGHETASRDVLWQRSAAVSALDAELADLRAQLGSLEQRRSNIPDADLRVRRVLAEGTGLPESDLPFVGELLDVAPDEEAWRTAAERLLGGFGVRMLVDAGSAARVAAFVDGHDLRTRVRWTPVDTGAPAPGAASEPGTMASKVVVADSPFAPWLRAQLARRYAHRCVEDVTQLGVLREAVTVQGQVKHRDGLHEKDDRPDVRRHRVIGFDNAHARRDVADAIAALEERRPALVRARDDADAAREHRRAVARAWQQLAALRWDEVDVESAEAALDDARHRREDVVTDGDLTALDARITARTEERDAANHRARTAREAAAAAEKAWARRLDEEDRVGARLDALPEPTDEQRAVLAEVARECDPEPTLETVGRLRKAVEQAVGQRLTTAESAGEQARAAIATTLADFLRAWPDETGTFTRDVQDVPAYLARLEDLRRDDLPAALDQWRRLMHSINTMGLTALLQQLRDERLVIDDRIDPINDVLRTVPFGHDGYLQIVTTDVEPPASRQFQAEIDAILEERAGGGLDDAELEARFARIARLMDRLDSTDPVDREWQRDVLDVKRHVRISAEEHRHGETQARVYEGVGATSGGEGQELIAATLGAALRYQLGGIEQVPVFGSVMVDEGFVKSDPDVTRRAIRALQSFGFQLVIAAPIDKYQSMEREFGSAYLVEHDPAAGRAHARGLPIGFGPTHRGPATA